MINYSSCLLLQFSVQGTAGTTEHFFRSEACGKNKRKITVVTSDKLELHKLQTVDFQLLLDTDDV